MRPPSHDDIFKLEEWAQGSLPLMAAVHLLTHSRKRYKVWTILVRRDDRDRPWLDAEGAARHLDAFGLSRGERAFVLLVIELADFDTDTPLAELLCRIDPADSVTFFEAARVLTRGV